MTDTMTQNQAILSYLETGASLTPLEALHKFGCFRLPARIWELRLAGWPIAAERVKLGDKRVASYRLDVLQGQVQIPV